MPSGLRMRKTIVSAQHSNSEVIYFTISLFLKYWGRNPNTVYSFLFPKNSTAIYRTSSHAFNQLCIVTILVVCIQIVNYKGHYFFFLTAAGFVKTTYLPSAFLHSRTHSRIEPRALWVLEFPYLSGKLNNTDLYSHITPLSKAFYLSTTFIYLLKAHIASGELLL